MEEKLRSYLIMGRFIMRDFIKKSQFFIINTISTIITIFLGFVSLMNNHC